ncbi:hypothetical protein F5Y14DRAFT_92444 [Nemania sp. NC0429]|nr:hypothetical protein F5Y14DRAFT_92444 [Nemania sp. NC0429]
MMSSSAATGTSQNGAVQQKHRACDECRARKLACSKESEGCSRCRREKIPCHYSVQKPMGRPRKRAREDTDERPLATVPPTKTTMTDLPSGVEDPGMQFVNNLFSLGIDFDFNPEPSTHAPQTTQTATATMTTTTTQVQALDMRQYPPWDHRNLGMIDFDSQPVEHTPFFSPTNIDPALFIPTASSDSPPADQVPALSPPNSNTDSPPQSVHASPAAPGPSTSKCDCMANLHAALNWMQNQPAEFEPAIRQARLATKVAYEVVNCPDCSFRLEPPAKHHATSPTMMRGFQAMMLLATLVPSIAHAYAAMLAMVDEETNRAVAERRKVVFQLKGLGGIWGGLDLGDKSCGTHQNFEYREMEPVMWRLAVRALLRVDVYGISACRGDIAPADPFHLGLKDIVTLMENKAKARHVFMDALIEAGVSQPHCAFPRINPGEPPTCQRIISIARSSVEQLCIA